MAKTSRSRSPLHEYIFTIGPQVRAENARLPQVFTIRSRAKHLIGKSHVDIDWGRKICLGSILIDTGRAHHLANPSKLSDCKTKPHRKQRSKSQISAVNRLVSAKI
jgi:hypothetical protein